MNNIQLIKMFKTTVLTDDKEKSKGTSENNVRYFRPFLTPTPITLLREI